MKPIKEMTQAELGAYVQSHLYAKGIDVVLSGGSVVSIYTSGKYVSKDLDFVNRYSVRRSTIRDAMEELGFEETGRYFEHPDNEFFVEFPPGPLSLGEDFNINIVQHKLETGTLRVISPTDCVKDRLAWYYHDGDLQCLVQAVMVAKDHKVDMQEILKWSEGEGKLEEFDRFKSDLESYEHPKE
jgi:hypothetical protein